MKFRRKPEPVDAIQYQITGRTPGKYFDQITRNGNDVAEFMGAELVQEMTVPADDKKSATTLVINAEGRNYTIPEGFWVVKDSAGKFHALSWKQFMDQFEPVPGEL